MKEPKIYVRKDRDIIYVEYELDGKRYQKSTYLNNSPKNLRNVRKVVDKIIEDGILSLDAISQRFKTLNQISKLAEDTGNKIKAEDIEEFDQAVKMSQYLSDVINVMLEARESKKLNSDIYRIVLDEFKNLCGEEIMLNITTKDFQKYKQSLEDRKLAYHTIQTYIKYLYIFFNWCIENQYYNRKNPVTKMKERDKAHITIIPQEEMDIILEHLKGSKVYNFIRFISYTGFRRNEAKYLKWQQVDFKNNVIKVITFKDNEREDVFPLNIGNGELKSILEEMYKLRKGDYVFDQTMHEDTMIRIFQRTLTELNLPKYTLHDIRRTCISRWATKLNPIELTKLARHKNVKTSMQYYINLDIEEIGNKV